MGKFSQYRQHFREEWKSDPSFQSWIEPVKDDNLKAYCKYCHIFLPAHYAGLTNHAGSSKHCRNTVQIETKNSKPIIPKHQKILLKHLHCKKSFSSMNVLQTSESEKHSDEEHCTLELTVDDMTLSQSIENPKHVESNSHNNSNMVVPSRSHDDDSVKDISMLGFEISNVELVKAPTSAELSELVNKEILSEVKTKMCDFLDSWQTNGKSEDIVKCKKELDVDNEVDDLPHVEDGNSTETHDAPSQAIPDQLEQNETTVSLGKDSISSEHNTLISRTTLNQHKQIYRKRWETNTKFQGWISPVHGDIYKACCDVCQVVFKANLLSLKEHSESSEHMANMACHFPSSIPQASVAGSSVHKPKMLERKVEEQDVACSKKESLVNISEDDDSSGVQTTREILKDECLTCADQDVVLLPSNTNRNGITVKTECTDEPVSKKLKLTQVKDHGPVRSYPQKYVLRWNNDPILKDWVAPVAGNVYKAWCCWCHAELRAHYKDLKHHAESTKHATNAWLRGTDTVTPGLAEDSDILDELLTEHEFKKKLPRRDDIRERKSKQNSCYFLSRSSWDRYKQKYRKAWEKDPHFCGWIAPVEGDIYRARCLYCRTLIRAHHRDLKAHSRTTKHATNVAFGLPSDNSQLNDMGSVIPKPKALKQRVIARRKRRQDLSSGPYEMDMDQTYSLLRPDDSLSSVDNLVKLASSLSGTAQAESTVTTLVFPNATKLDESIVSALPDNPKMLYRVKKLSADAINGGTSVKKKMPEEVNIQEQVTRLLKKVTLWEILRMKVERNNGGLRIPEMLAEFNSLHEQVKRITKERLIPVEPLEESSQHSLHRKSDAVMVLSSDKLAKLLDMSVGHYRIKDMSGTEAKTANIFSKQEKERSAISTEGSASVSSVRGISGEGMQSALFTVDHDGQPVLSASELVFTSADHVIQLQDPDCMPSGVDNDALVYTNTDGTLFIHVSGPGENQIPLNVIQSLFAAKEDSRKLNSTGDSVTAMP